jgi:replication-associated recombination protein RarA
MINLLKSAKTPMVVPFNFSFEGNPGTGKTTVARLFSGIFKEFGFLPRKSNEFVEISVHELKEKSSEELDALLKTTTFIFIDEAYLLDPKNDPSGARVADKLLSVAEKHRGRVSIVLAGYEEEMDKKFFAYNQGLRGRFKTVKFENFTKEELKKIWVDTLKQNGFKGDNTLANVVCRRLEKRSTEKDFGNARAVRQTFEDAVNSAAGRVQTGDLKLIVEDVLGPRVDCNDEKIKPLLDKIYQSYGWKRVAEAVRDLIAVVQKNYDREIAGETQLPLQKNRVLLGSPGVYAVPRLRTLHFSQTF